MGSSLIATNQEINNAPSPDSICCIGSRLTQMVYPDGSAVDYGYDGNALDNAIGRVDYLANDSSGTPVTPHIVNYQYLGLGTIVVQSFANGITSTYEATGSG